MAAKEEDLQVKEVQLVAQVEELEKAWAKGSLLGPVRLLSRSRH